MFKLINVAPIVPVAPKPVGPKPATPVAGQPARPVGCMPADMKDRLAFRTADRNGDGMVTIVEYVGYGAMLPRERAAKMMAFKAADQDGNGKLSQREYLAAKHPAPATKPTKPTKPDAKPVPADLAAKVFTSLAGPFAAFGPLSALGLPGLLLKLNPFKHLG